MKIVFFLAVALGRLSFVFAAEASTPSSSVSSSTSESSSLVLPKSLENRQFEEASEITDSKIRAESGSRSRYSAKFNLSYFGPTLNDASTKSQPNPDNSNAPKSTALGGSVSTRFRLDKSSSLGFGTGVKAVTPNYGFNRFDVNNPYLNYDYTQKIGSAQIRNALGVSAITIPEYKNIGETAALNLDQSIAYQIAASPFFVTLDTSLSYYLYNRGYNPGPTKKGGDGKAQRYSFQALPGLKYRMSDSLSLSTSVAIGTYNPRSHESSLILWRSSVTQRVAMGWAITRDVYIQPYFDLYPQALAIDTTTVNITTVFSIL